MKRLLVLALAACSNPPSGTEAASPVDGAPMVVVGAMIFQMGSAESHPDLPKAAPVVVHPYDALLFRAEDS
jgi:hypothetical protein